jgi:hypothetical protein
MNTKPNPDEQLLTAEDVERIYRIKVETQRVWRQRRQIPYLRLGGGKLIRYSRNALDAWVASRAVAVRS